MDFNIAAILHFATKREGYLYDPLNKDKKQPIQSSAKVMISGLGKLYSLYNLNLYLLIYY